jgi:hypothetical protein
MLAQKMLQAGGALYPLIIPAHLIKGTGLCNPSIFVDGGKVIGNVRNVHYDLYHCEFGQKFRSPFGPLVYMHPEDDRTLRTDNYYVEYNNDFSFKRYNKIDTSVLDIPPVWEFIGLEDGRLVRWDGKLYLCGVRRDTKPNGEGRMELSELLVGPTYVKEVNRYRIQPPNNAPSYCEKNWMPVLDTPWHFVKWTNPTEVVKVDINTLSSQTVFMGNQKFNLPRDIRGGSNVITIGDKRLAITHEVDLWWNENNAKDSQYYHRFVVWDKNWNIVKFTPTFKFMDAYIEFCTGMEVVGDDILIVFGFQDSSAHLLKAPAEAIVKYIFST